MICKYACSDQGRRTLSLPTSFVAEVGRQHLVEVTSVEDLKQKKLQAVKGELELFD